jgi:integrase
MELDRYLTRRKGSTIWYARVPVPRQLQAALGKTNIWKSLGTEDRTEATIRAVQFVSPLRRDWDRLLNGGNQDQPNPSTRPTKELLEATAVRYAYELLLNDFDKQRSSFASMSLEDYEAYCQHREERLRQRQMEVATGNLGSMADAARGIIAREKWQLDEADPLFHKFCGYLAQANLASFRTHEARLKGDVHAESADRIVTRVKARQARKANDGERLLDLFDKYAEARLREHSKRPDTLREDRKTIQLLASFVGEDRRPSAIEDEEAREFRDLLFRLPISLTKRKDYQGLTLRQAAEKAAIEGVRTLDIKTVRKHISTLSPFFAWLIDERYARKNPFDRLLPRKPRLKSQRPPFSVEQVNAFLGSPLYSGFLDEGSEHLPGAMKKRDWRFWIPLLCLFSGARVGEVAQLRVEDIYMRDGFWFMDFKEDPATGQQSKSRKTSSVAVHPKLTAIGFLAFVQSELEARGTGPLFPEIKKNVRDHAGAQPSRFLRDYLSRIGIKGERDGLGAHSFRHLMADQLRLAGYLDIELGPLVLGHSSPVPTTGGYGKGEQGTAQRLYSMIAAVQFEGVSFDHLIPEEARSKVPA